MNATKIDYELLEKERSAGLKNELAKELQDRKSSASTSGLRRVVLGSVVDGNYEGAVFELKQYIKDNSELPQLIPKTERLVIHCEELINAIETKRNFPGLESLSMSKQQEILEKVLDHFEELKMYIKKIEKIYYELRMTDLRTTVWTLRAAVYVVFAVILTGFVLEMSRGLGSSLNLVLDQFIFDVLKGFLDLTGW